MRSEPASSLLTAQDIANLRQLVRNGRNRLSEWRRRSLGLRGLSLYLLSSPLVLAAVVGLATGSERVTFGAAAAWVMIVGGARLNRLAMLERLLAPARRYTQTRRLPFQPVAAALVSSGTALGAHFAAGQGVLISLAYGGVAMLGFYLAYRLPSAASRSGTLPTIDDPVLRRTLADAEKRLLAIESAALRIGNPELERRLHDIAAQGRQILDLLADRPADLYRTRRFFNVHLDGAEKVAVRFARMHRLVRGGVLESSFRNVLAQIETAFRRQQRHLIDQDVTDLDVQIEVLRKQLQREGIA